MLAVCLKSEKYKKFASRYDHKLWRRLQMCSTEVYLCNSLWSYMYLNWLAHRPHQRSPINKLKMCVFTLHWRQISTSHDHQYERLIIPIRKLIKNVANSYPFTPLLPSIFFCVYIAFRMKRQRKNCGEFEGFFVWFHWLYYPRKLAFLHGN